MLVGLAQAYLSGCFAVSLGRWPEKSVRFITRLLKNAESNADAKSIDVEELLIKNIVVQQAPVRPFPKAVPSSSALSHVNLPTPIFDVRRKPAAVHTVPTVVSTPTRATLATSKSSSAQERSRSSARRTRMPFHRSPALTGDRSPGGVSRPLAFKHLPSLGCFLDIGLGVRVEEGRGGLIACHHCLNSLSFLYAYAMPENFTRHGWFFMRFLLTRYGVHACIVDEPSVALLNNARLRLYDRLVLRSLTDQAHFVFFRWRRLA